MTNDTNQNATFDPVKLREREIDRIYGEFMAATDVPNNIHYKEFKKYEVLYSDEMRKKVAEHTLTSDEENMISELSQEFYRRINTRKPIHVVDDQGNDVIPPLPPIYRKLNSLDTDETASAAAVFHTAFSTDSTGVIADNKKAEATVLLNNTFMSVQSPEKLKQDINEFDKLTSELNKSIGKQNTTKPQKSNTPPEGALPEEDDLEWD
jgi:uncharacterized protein YnzC (UPF0291/DUF896 family)